jgi:hypothetical protein
MRGMIAGLLGFRRRVALIVALLGFLLLYGVSQVMSVSPPRVTIDPGLRPVMSASDAIRVAQSEIALMAGDVGRNPASTISSARALRGSDITSAEPDGPIFTGDQALRTYWLIRGSGTFVPEFGRSNPKRVYGTGYLIIDDASGEIVGTGMP